MTRMARTGKTPLRHAYLLRCWQEGEATPGKNARWRFSLEGVLQKRPRQGFDNLEALVTFLQSELADKGEGASE